MIRDCWRRGNSPVVYYPLQKGRDSGYEAGLYQRQHLYRNENRLIDTKGKNKESTKLLK